MVGGAWLGKAHGDDWALLGVIWGLAAATALGCLVNRIVLRRLMRRRGVPEVAFAEARRELPLLWTFSLPVLFINVLSVLGPWGAAAIFVHKIGMKPGYAALGVFNAANQWQYPVTLLSSQVAAVLLPMLASFPPGADGRRRSDRAIEAAHLVVVIAVLPLAALLSCVAGPVMAIYGPQFAGAVWVFWAAIFVAGLRSAATIPGMVLLARGAIWTSFLIGLGWALVLLALALTGVRSAENYADAFSAAQIAATLAGLIYSALRRYCSWSFVAQVLFVIACLVVVTYGMSFAGSIWVRLSLVAGACVVAGVAALKAWRELKSGIPAPSPGA
jgi:O-antigen/teichoic acid export membrane protein